MYIYEGLRVLKYAHGRIPICSICCPRERERESERRKEREGDRERVNSAIDIHSYLLYWSSCDIKRLTDVVAMVLNLCCVL